MRRSLAATALATVLAGCTVVGIRSGSEQLPFTLVERLGEQIEVRHYGPRLAAEVTVDAASDWEGRNAAFRILAGYIFGANRGRSEIAMTTPVEVAKPAAAEKIAMTIPVETAAAPPGQVVMRFFMPAGSTRATLPEPTDSRIRLIEYPETHQAALTFSGASAAEELPARRAQLLAALERSTWQAAGEAVLQYYDPPWTLPFARRNEVLIPVTRR